jgi:hypothetical protein
MKDIVAPVCCPPPFCRLSLICAATLSADEPGEFHRPNMNLIFHSLLAVGLLATRVLSAAEPAQPLPQAHEYAAAMKQVAAKFKGRPGVVLHVGDSITYANPYGAWARAGAGKTDADKAVLGWMHTGKDNDSDGWWLCRVDLPGGRSHTACSGIRFDQMLAGGKSQMPSLAQMIEKHRPQVVVLMLGTNDTSAGRKAEDVRRDLVQAIELLTNAGVIPIVSTIPPHVGKPELGRAVSAAIRAVAKEKQLPLIDYEQEILTRRPDDWDGTLMNKGDVHPSAAHAWTTPSSAPTSENLKNSGYLLRGWLSVRKIAEVKRTVLDANRP